MEILFTNTHHGVYKTILCAIENYFFTTIDTIEHIRLKSHLKLFISIVTYCAYCGEKIPDYISDKKNFNFYRLVIIINLVFYYFICTTRLTYF